MINCACAHPGPPTASKADARYRVIIRIAAPFPAGHGGYCRNRTLPSAATCGRGGAGVVGGSGRGGQLWLLEETPPVADGRGRHLIVLAEGHGLAGGRAEYVQQFVFAGRGRLICRIVFGWSRHGGLPFRRP